MASRVTSALPLDRRDVRSSQLRDPNSACSSFPVLSVLNKVRPASRGNVDQGQSRPSRSHAVLLTALSDSWQPGTESR
jgi:hypothetical protein